MAINKKNSSDSSKTLIWPFGKKNYVLFGVALAVITLGYIFLGYGDHPDNAISKTLAPIVLILGYAIIPFAILAKDSSSKSDQNSDSLS